MPAGARVHIEIPDAHRGTHGDASALAKARGDVLADYIHDAILTATVAAEAGRGDLLPPKPAPERRRRSSDKDEAVETTKPGIRYKAAEGERDRCWHAIYAAGSSPAAVAVEALTAYQVAEGVRLNVQLPWVPRLRSRGQRDPAGVSSPLRRAGAA